MLRTLRATRYVTPLREGGSLPAIIEADDRQLYVLKFRGAGQGEKALVAELLAGQLARALGLRVPELVFVEVDPVLGRNEPDYEIRELIKASAGKNLALAYLAGAVTFDPVAGPIPDPELASLIVGFDAYVSNLDRSAKNPNMLGVGGELWLIDHGAALYFHHGANDWQEHAGRAFPAVRQHVLLPFASALEGVGARMRAALTADVRSAAVRLLPDAWLSPSPPFDSPAARRAAYLTYLAARLDALPKLIEEAIRVRAELV
jgi:hypothetical protein